MVGIDGISAGAGQTILTEVGLDLRAIPTEKHYASWPGPSPRTAVSGGKPPPKKKTNGMGASRTAAVLRMGAVTVRRSRSALGAAFRRVASQGPFGHGLRACAQTGRSGAPDAAIRPRLRGYRRRAYEMRLQLQRIAGLGADTTSLVWILIDATLPLLFGSMGMFLVRNGNGE